MKGERNMFNIIFCFSDDSLSHTTGRYGTQYMATIEAPDQNILKAHIKTFCDTFFGSNLEKVNFYYGPAFSIIPSNENVRYSELLGTIIQTGLQNLKIRIEGSGYNNSMIGEEKLLPTRKIITYLDLSLSSLYAITSCPPLTERDMRLIYAHRAGLKHLCINRRELSVVKDLKLADFPLLTDLNLSNNDITPGTAAEILFKLKKLRYLKLGSNFKFQDNSSFPVFLNQLKKSAELTNLVLENNSIDGDGCSQLIKIFATRSGEQLDLSNNLGIDKSMNALSEVLPTNTSLKEVKLQGQGQSQASMISYVILMNALTLNFSLCSLPGINRNHFLADTHLVKDYKILAAIIESQTSRNSRFFEESKKEKSLVGLLLPPVIINIIMEYLIYEIRTKAPDSKSSVRNFLHMNMTERKLFYNFLAQIKQTGKNSYETINNLEKMTIRFASFTKNPGDMKIFERCLSEFLFLYGIETIGRFSDENTIVFESLPKAASEKIDYLFTNACEILLEHPVERENILDIEICNLPEKWQDKVYNWLSTVEDTLILGRVLQRFLEHYNVSPTYYAWIKLLLKKNVTLPITSKLLEYMSLDNELLVATITRLQTNPSQQPQFLQSLRDFYHLRNARTMLANIIGACEIGSPLYQGVREILTRPSSPKLSEFQITLMPPSTTNNSSISSSEAKHSFST